MKYKKVIARFQADDIEIAEELICDIFFDLNLKGVVCDIPIEEPDEGFGTHTLLIPEVNSITGYLPLQDSTDRLFETIKEKTLGLENLNIRVTLQSQIVDEDEWSESWKTYFEVVRVTDRIIIKPLWKTCEAQKDDIIIHLDPGMAFGTGTHPTTAGCLKMIETHLTPGGTFLDIGTGSGILMIAAAKLGAGHTTGIDTDETAITVAGQNLLENDIDPGGSDLFCTPLDKTDVKQFDCIAANIIAQVIVDILSDIALRMGKKTITILSGIIRERQEDVMTALTAQRLSVIQEEVNGEWVTLAVQKQP